MELILDAGNTRIKAGVMENGQLLSLRHFQRSSQLKELASFCKEYQTLPAIVSDVSQPEPELENALSALPNLIRFSWQSKLPFTIAYRTPQTLGNDRMAATAAAAALFPGTNCLVIDAGTCITYDLVTAESVYLGGAISPGLSMRYQALHTFTGKLPLIEHVDFENSPGQTTEESILTGVQHGLVAEVNGMIERYTLQQGELKVLVCGGDTGFLAKRLKYDIFAEPNLVLTGLYHILKLHAA